MGGDVNSSAQDVQLTKVICVVFLLFGISMAATLPTYFMDILLNFTSYA